MRQVALLGVLVMAASSGCGRIGPASGRGSLQQVSRQAVSPRDLRGYGRLGGEFTLYRDGGGARVSRLRIRCADEEKARIVHAKYLSDLHLLGDVRDEPVIVGAHTLPAATIPHQGQVAAWRRGRTVEIVAAETRAALRELLGGLPSREWRGAELTPSRPVPMFLDSWDKYGFRYYYRPWESPTPDWGAPAKIPWEKYEVLREFDFARDYGPIGLIFWATQDMVDTAEGLNNNLLWDWAARSAARRRLPIIVNTMGDGTTWLFNRYRDDIRQMAPHYCGGYYAPGESGSSGKGNLSWSSTESADAELAILQEYVRDYARQDTTLEYLEPQGEIRHGEHDILTEYGPVADRSYRRFLKARYGTLAAVSRRWHGDRRRLKRWDDVRVPELAHFLGFNERAVDLAGPWRVRFDPPEKGTPPPAPDLYQPSFDDAAWPTLATPGSDVALFLPRRPAVFRRRFTVDPAWRREHPRVWLYVLDLNRGRYEQKMPVVLNGQTVGESRYEGPEHWQAYEVSKALRAGDNLLALRLPQGFFGYRVYLSPREPADYPYLGEGMNAQWADFIRWQAWTRTAMVRRGFSMIRQADLDRSVICMSPDSHQSGIKELCEQYGGHFHNTGYMSSWWAERLPMLMRGSDLPFSLEPGNHPHSVREFKLFFGHWATEGVGAVHYFIHLGAVMWHPQIRDYFVQQLPVVRTIGKTHVPKGKVAFLLTDDVENLTGFPWGHHRGDTFASGYVPWQVNMKLRNDTHMDAVSDLDFADGGADAYPVVIDTNTSVMDPERIAEIAAWVRRGGTFVTFVQTGRHTPEVADSWPIRELTGYRVLKVDPRQRPWKFAPGQDVLDEAAWPKATDRRGSGLALEAADPACRDLIRWDDGSTAVGIRPLGKGRVIHVGLMWDHNPRLHRQLLEWLGIPRIPMRIEGKPVTVCHSVSNSGLYDAWTLWNHDLDHAVTTDLVFRDGLRPPVCLDVKSGGLVPLTDVEGECRAAGLAFHPGETRVFLTPRQAVVTAPLEWLTLQRNWWRGTAKPIKRLAPFVPRFAHHLTEGWAIQPLDESDAADHTALAAPGLDDRAWPRVRLSLWMVPEERATHRAIFRRQFTVPAAWKGGEIELWLQNWWGNVLHGRIRVWLDGKEIKAFDTGPAAVPGLNLTASLEPGSSHLLAVEVRASSQAAGPAGHTWLTFLPHAQHTQDLAGEWRMTGDGLTWADMPARLPGRWEGLMGRRTVAIPRDQAGRNILLRIETDLGSAITGAIVNGHYVMRHHHDIGTRTHLNISPWLRPGGENELILVRRGAGTTRVHSVVLEYFDRDVYP